MTQNTLNQQNKKIPGRFIFLGFVVLMYLITYIFAGQDVIVISAQKTGFMLLKIIPILSLVFLLMTLMNYFLTTKSVKKHLGKDSGIKKYFYATIFGILVSGPPYVLFPMLKDLKEKGVSDKLLAIFLYNRNIKIPFLIVMIYYFGIAYTIIISVLILIFAIFNGIIIEYFLDKYNINQT